MNNKKQNQNNLTKLRRFEEKRQEYSGKLEDLRISHNKELILLHSNYENQRKETVNKYNNKKNNLKKQFDKVQDDIVKILESIEQKENGIITNESLENILSVIEEPSFTLDEPLNEEEAMDNLFNEMKDLLN